MPAVKFLIGNTHQILYVDFFGDEDDVDLILKINFHIRATTQASQCPIKINSRRWRFQISKKIIPVQFRVSIIGRGGSVRTLNFRPARVVGGKEGRIYRFFESRPGKPLRPVPMPEGNFGIELELSTLAGISTEDVARTIRDKAGADAEDMTDDYSAACSRNDIWVIMWDASLVCSRDNPECNRFELKSPILRGRQGLEEVNNVITALEGIKSSINVNNSMGFHVHVNISELSKYQLTSICQNFIKYERALDSLMPPSRREGNNYIKSNRLAVGATEGYDPEQVKHLADCTSKEKLAELMCPDSKYYKLNLRPFLESGSKHKPTIEFRQHSSTYNKLKIKNWIRFCMSFVHNSAKQWPPGHLRGGVSDHELLDMLMMRVVKDRFLRDYYRQRRAKFLQEDDNNCCDGCAFDNGCEAQISK
mmetsp:Transcript_30715/g.74167  ORF Transcript_30715/g.74167 Transcript_30715/m.74167 type:complete len:420 (-) Transcript_30715:116-1375(-)